MAMSLCVFAMLVKLLEKCAFYAFYGRRGALRASKNYHDRTRLQISFKTSLSSIQKKKKQNASKKYVFFKLYSKVSVWIVNGSWMSGFC